MRYYVNYGQGWQSFEGHQSYEGTDILHMLARMFEMWHCLLNVFYVQAMILDHEPNVVTTFSSPVTLFWSINRNSTQSRLATHFVCECVCV